MSLEQGDIAVVGAGVIGLMTSLSLLDAGRSVTLIDPDPPGQGASFGNAGVIANYGVKPLAEPSLLLTGPRTTLQKGRSACDPTRCWAGRFTLADAIRKRLFAMASGAPAEGARRRDR